MAVSLAKVFEGWEGYNTSLVKAVAPRTPDELAFRPAEGMRSVGEIAAHIGLGRVDWFHRMGAPGAAELARRVEQEAAQGDGPLERQESLTGDADALVRWLEASWRMVAAVLDTWTVDDLPVTFLQPYRGKTYAVSRQWVLWRMLTHDVQHGGQLTVMLWMQGISIPELGDLGGHLTEPPEAG
jgi:uncharacterized damage-inducible protein DinB